MKADEAGLKASTQANMDDIQSMVRAGMSKILGDMNVDRSVSDTEEDSDTRDTSA